MGSGVEQGTSLVGAKLYRLDSYHMWAAFSMVFLSSQ